MGLSALNPGLWADAHTHSHTDFLSLYLTFPVSLYSDFIEQRFTKYDLLNFQFNKSYLVNLCVATHKQSGCALKSSDQKEDSVGLLLLQEQTDINDTCLHFDSFNNKMTGVYFSTVYFLSTVKRSASADSDDVR